MGRRGKSKKNPFVNSRGWIKYSTFFDPNLLEQLRLLKTLLQIIHERTIFLEDLINEAIREYINKYDFKKLLKEATEKIKNRPSRSRVTKAATIGVESDTSSPLYELLNELLIKEQS